MKIAWCLSGHFRTADLPPVRDAFHKYVIEPYNPDIYIATWDKRGSSKWSNDSKINPDDIITEKLVRNTYPNIVGCKVFDYNHFTETYKEHPSLINNIWNSFPQFYLMQLLCYDFKWYAERYDCVAWSRPDFIYTREIPEKIFQEPDTIHHINVPPHHYPNRVYATWIGSSQKIFEDYAHNMFLKHVELRDMDCGTGLTPDDPCKMLYCYLKDKYPIKSADYCFGDIYR